LIAARVGHRECIVKTTGLEDAERSVRLFGEEVMPRFGDVRLDTGPAPE